MMEQLRAHPGKPLRPKEFQMMTKSVEDQPLEEMVHEGTTLQELALKQMQVDLIRAKVTPRFISSE